ncbi:MAG: PAS-domain containing protein, partial [Alphaproteobacteria bacterium]|nr:PAS-domain containing protein [Alphaproteobacteria bacterium]
MILPFFATYTPVLAIIAAVAAVLIVILLEAGVAGTMLVVIIQATFIIFLSWLVWMLNRNQQHHERAVRQFRFTAERFQSMVRTLPGGYCLFTPQGLLREEVGVSKLLGREKLSHFDDLVGALKDGPELVDAFRRLQLNGEDFSIQTKAVANQNDLQVAGRRFRIGKDGPVVDVIWFGSNPAIAQQMHDQMVALSEAEVRAREVQALLNTIRFPIWVRSQNLNLVMCNKAYAKALDATSEEVVTQQHELMSQTARGGSGRTLAANALSRGVAESERRHVIIAGRRHLLEITEIPCTEAGDKIALIGFAIDVTTEEEKETELQRHLAAHREVMEHLGAAIAIYGPDTKLEFYNRAYQHLWETEESFLDSHPTFGEILEDLRTRRRIPEQADFQRYKKERLALFTSLLEPHDDLMYLPDGTSLRILSVPHPFGGIMFVHEDVTDKLALESSYNTLIAVQRETLDNLAEGIAVFGPDGKLSLSNPAFARIWKLPHDYLAAEPHIADLLEHMKPLFNYGANWAEFKKEWVEYTLDRSSRVGRIERADQSVIETLTVPLPDGAVLNSYLDVSDSVKAEQALRASNLALANADRLKSEFVANVSYQLRTPLNTIMGFAEILTNQYFGALNERQLEYTRTVMEASKRLLLLINDVLDLATIEAGRMELNRHPLPVAELLNAAKQMTSEWARQQSLSVTIDCPTDIGSFVVDEQRMK